MICQCCLYSTHNCVILRFVTFVTVHVIFALIFRGVIFQVTIDSTEVYLATGLDKHHLFTLSVKSIELQLSHLPNICVASIIS